MSSYSYELSATPEQLKAIGMVATEWQRLESIVEGAIWLHAGLDPDTGKAITTHLTTPLRLQILRTLFHQQKGEGPIYDEISDFCKKIERLSRKRSEIVHSQWVRGDYGSPMTLTVTARGRLKEEKIAKSAKIIEGIAADIAQLSDALEQFILEQRQFVQTLE